MKFIRVTGTAAVFLFCGSIMPAFAQNEGEGGKNEGKQESKPDKPAKPQGSQVKAAPKEQQHATQAAKAQQPRKQQQPKVAQQPAKQQPAKVVQQTPEQQPPQRSKQQAQAWQKQRGWQGGWKGNDTWQGDRAQRWTSDHRTWAQRGGYGGSYIPQASFNLNFGSGHFFRLVGQPVMDMGYPRFEYRGYSFLLVDPYPEYWAANWYELDDVYIAYDDGYYLCNRNYPQVQLAVIVEL